MAAIRSVEEIARTWATVTPQRSPDFEAGVRAPKADWARNTLAAADSWKAGIQAAIAAGSFSKGVTKSGTPVWQEATLAKGVARWGPGVALAEDKFSTAFAPFQAAIARVTLPPRFARRDPRNLLRVNAIVDALIKAKAAISG